MRRTLAAAALILLGGTGLAHADTGAHRHNSIGLGFHNAEAPVGLRWWMAGQRVALDFGLGFFSEPAGLDPDERESTWAFEAGVPIVVSSWERIHVLLRPGVLLVSEEVGFDGDPTTPGIEFDTANETAFALTGEIEAEVFLTDNFSVSASHGIGFVNVDPAGPGDSESFFGTFGNNVTEIGFHVYFLGSR
jgi:hypothetical protein